MRYMHIYPSLNDYATSCLCAWQLLSHVLSFVLMSPRASVRDPSKGLQNDFLGGPEKCVQPGPDPHLDQLESICYCKYKFSNV